MRLREDRRRGVVFCEHAAQEARRVDRGRLDGGTRRDGARIVRSDNRPRTLRGARRRLHHHKAPCGAQKAGRSLVDRGKRGIKRSVVVDAEGIPLGVIAAPANRHDSPLLLSETLDIAGELPERASVHLERAYDSKLTRGLVEHRGLIGVISRRKVNPLRSKPGCGGSSRGPTPPPGTTPTRSSLLVHRASGTGHRFLALGFSNVVIVVRRLIRKAWSRYR